MQQGEGMNKTAWRKEVKEGKTVSIQVIAWHSSMMTVCWTGNETRKLTESLLKEIS
jgi:hypothetical protein